MIQLGLLTVLTLIAFAGNSILNRMALAEALISPEAFAAIRLTSGALALGLMVSLRQRSARWLRKGSAVGATALGVYAIGFSFGYLRIDAGLGALLLFGVVQITMFAAALIHRQETISRARWFGTAMAFGGLVLLLLPGTVAPSPVFAAMMVISAVAWGVYSLVGKSATEPLASTAANFLYAAPAALLVWFFIPPTAALTSSGVGLALLSGVVTSGMGYALWYYILPQLRTTTAALTQVTVPIIAALGGILLLGEEITLAFIASAVLVLAGVVVSLRR